MRDLRAKRSAFRTLSTASVRIRRVTKKRMRLQVRSMSSSWVCRVDANRCRGCVYASSRNADGGTIFVGVAPALENGLPIFVEQFDPAVEIRGLLVLATLG